MNPEFDSTRQALEARLTALLLGELDPEQARALNEMLVRDPELSKLHARLKQTIELVRETAVEHAGHNATATVPLKLSERRRQELLQRFKTVTPKEFAEPKKRSLRVSLVLVAAMVVVVGLLAAIFLQTQHAFRSSFTLSSDIEHSAAPATNSPVAFSAPATPQSPPENDGSTLGGGHVFAAGGERGLGTVPHAVITPIVLPPVENATPPLTPLIAPGNQSVAFAVPGRQENLQAGQAGNFGWQPKPAVTAGGPGGGGAGASSVVMEDVKLRDAIQDLAHRAGREYSFDPSLDFNRSAAAPDAKAVPEPTVSMHWDNTTPDQALDGLLGHYNLKVVEDPNNKSVGKIVPSGLTTITPGAGGGVVNFANVAPSPSDRTAVSEGIRRGDGTVALAYQSPGAVSGMMTNSVGVASATSANLSDLELFRGRYGLSPAAPARPNPNQTPANAQTKVQDGKLLLEMGRLNEAEVALKSAVEADPNNNQAHYYLNLTKDARLKNELASREKSAQVSLLQNENAWATPHKGVGLDWNGSADTNSRFSVDGVDGGFASNPAAPAWTTSVRAFYDDLEPQKREPAVAAGEPVTGLPRGGKVLVGSGAVDRARLQSEAAGGRRSEVRSQKSEGTALTDTDQLLTKSMRGSREVNGDPAWIGALEAPKASDAMEPATRLPVQNSSGNQVLATPPPNVSVAARFNEASSNEKAKAFDWYLGNALAGKDTPARQPTIASAASDQLLTKSMRGGREVNGDIGIASSFGTVTPPAKSTGDSNWNVSVTLRGFFPDDEASQKNQEFADRLARKTEDKTDFFSQQHSLLADGASAGTLFKADESGSDKERGRLDLPKGPLTGFSGVTAGVPSQTNLNTWALADTKQVPNPNPGFLGLTTNYQVTAGIGGGRAPVASPNVESLADRISAAGAETNSYDRNTYYRLLGRLADDKSGGLNLEFENTLTPGLGHTPSNRFVTRNPYLPVGAGSNIILPGSEPAQLARTEKQVMQYANGRDITPSLEQLARPAETPAPAQSSSTAAQLAEKQRQLEELQRLRQMLYLKAASEKIDTELPKNSMVTVVDRATPPTKSPSLWDKLTGNRPAAVARIKIDRDQSDIAELDRRKTNSGGKNGGGVYDPYFIQTETEVLKSELVLGKVVESLGLEKAWGKKDGEPLKTAEAVNLLKKKLDLEPVKNTQLMEIRVKDENPAESAALANKIAEAYRDYRVEERKKLSMGGISALKEEFEEQEQKVRKVQEEVDRLRKQLKVSDLALNSSEPSALLSADTLRRVEALRIQGKATAAEVAKKEADEPPKARPAVPPPIPQPEIATRDNAWSTFSLNVSDVSFKLAGASLEKGQLPDPASIRSEEFINAFDYRDPEPSAGVPVAFAWERAQYPFAQNRDLLRFSLKTAAQGRQPGRPLNIVLLLDNSGSMERADRVQIIREALKILAAQLQPQDKFSLVTFARTPRLLVDGVPGDQAAPVADEVSGLTPQGGTNLEEAMNLAYQTATRHYLANGVNRVVLLTDGAANLGDVKPESLKQKVEAQRKQGIALDCFGIGWEGFNDDLLEVLSRNGDGRYGFINTPGEAATEFAGQLAGALQVAASDVKVQVEFNPARVTAYRQIGYAKHQLTKEQFRDNTVDAAEIGAAEAGNALYTVEVNPAGEGPLATVRVRYKVPGTSDYREQEWAVPYAGAAPALGQASSAMRLAASASAFSEWLATNPYAGDVNPDQLLAYLTGVPEVYGADTRPKRLEWMIRQAKSLAGK